MNIGNYKATPRDVVEIRAGSSKIMEKLYTRKYEMVERERGREREREREMGGKRIGGGGKEGWRNR